MIVIRSASRGTNRIKIVCGHLPEVCGKKILDPSHRNKPQAERPSRRVRQDQIVKF
jgi:hypothetical protein